MPIEAFYDADGNAITPKTITWSLHYQDWEVVNSRSDESETPDTAVTIALYGDDTTLPNSLRRTRYLTVEYTYDTATISDVPAGMELEFIIDPLPGV